MSVNIKHIDDSSLTISKQKYGKGYQYFDENGERLRDKKILARLRKLIIPPMWTEVKICKWSDGHIQAIGRDAKGRKQYIYHSEWERQRQELKFARMQAFGQNLPAIRKAALADAQKKKWVRSKVLALMVLILDETGIRIGNRQYLKKNNTHGLTTLRRKHMEVEDDVLIFEYQGKSGKERHVEIDDDELIRMIRASAQQPGYELFRYKTGPREYENVDSDEVNEYIRSHMGEDFSSKDFRTWVATRYAIELYPEAIQLKEIAPRRKFANILLRLVADELGNTPTVCKSYYVHPKVMSLIDDQKIPVNNFKDDEQEHGFSSEEKLLMQLIASSDDESV